MAYQFSFEKLNVWQDSRLLTKEIYQITKEFPDFEKFGMANQMRRAAVSISSNIAEGSSRKSSKDQSHFYQISFSSLMELLNQLIISCDLDYIGNDTLISLRYDIEKIANKLNALRNSQLNK